MSAGVFSFLGRRAPVLRRSSGPLCGSALRLPGRCVAFAGAFRVKRPSGAQTICGQRAFLVWVRGLPLSARPQLWRSPLRERRHRPRRPRHPIPSGAAAFLGSGAPSGDAAGLRGCGGGVWRPAPAGRPAHASSWSAASRRLDPFSGACDPYAAEIAPAGSGNRRTGGLDEYPVEQCRPPFRSTPRARVLRGSFTPTTGATSAATSAARTGGPGSGAIFDSVLSARA